MKKRLAVSIGDPNGVGPEIALRAHAQISRLCTPLYCVAPELMAQAASMLKMEVPSDFACIAPEEELFTLRPGVVDAQAGRYSFGSFQKACDLADGGEAAGIVTLPVHKKAWELAGLDYKGHTDYLRRRYGRDAIMMLGCPSLWVALFTEHIPLKEVAGRLDAGRLADFLVRLSMVVTIENGVVLGLNPHAGDEGVLGSEEREIEAAIRLANLLVGRKVYSGPAVPDTAFTPKALAQRPLIVALYHDQGLAPLKALYFEESINVSLDLPIRRSSVDHGTALDIAYRGEASLKSYLNAVNFHL